MSSSRDPSIFAWLGFETQGYRGGAYHLRAIRNGSLAFDGVALLYSSGPIADTQTIELFELDGRDRTTGEPPSAEQIDRMLDCWSVVDARRLGESGLVPIKLTLADFRATVGQDQLSMLRTADPERTRHYSLLNTGDAVCYN